MPLQKFFAFPVFNTVTPSSVVASFARPPSGSIIQQVAPAASAADEIINDVEWLQTDD